MKSRLAPYMLCLAAFLALPLAVSAGTLVFDFDGGIDSQWEAFNSAGIWTVGTTGPDLSISKPDDPVAAGTEGFIHGGIQSVFELDGDFDVTVDFTLSEFSPDPTAPQGLTESVLSVNDGVGGSFIVLRFSVTGFPQWIEAYSPSVGQIGQMPAPAEVLFGGKYRIQRVGSTLTGFWAAPGSADFQAFGSAVVSALPMRVVLEGVQTINVLGFDRASNPVDIAFDNLVIQGATTSPVEPSSWGQIKGAYR